MGNCIRCTTPLQRSPEASGLTTIKNNGSGGIEVMMGNFIPVRAHVCVNCGYLELRLEQPQNI